MTELYTDWELAYWMVKWIVVPVGGASFLMWLAHLHSLRDAKAFRARRDARSPDLRNIR